MHTFHSSFFGCKWPMKKSYEKHWKTILYLPITYRKITSMILLSSLTKSKNTYNTAGFVYVRDTYSHHMCLSHDIHMVTTSTYVMILTSVIFWHKLQTIDQNIYLFVKKTTMMHTLHINCFRCKWPMKKSYEKHWKTILYLPFTNNLQKNNFYDLTCNFGQVQNMYNTAGFLYVRDTYSHHMCLSHDIHMVSTSTYVKILISVIFGHGL